MRRQRAGNCTVSGRKKTGVEARARCKGAHVQSCHHVELGCGRGQGVTDGCSRVPRAGGPALRRALPARLSLPGLPVNVTGDPINTSSLSNPGVPGFSAWVS